MSIGQAIFQRTELLLGEEAMRHIADQRVIIFGLMLASLVIRDVSC